MPSERATRSATRKPIRGTSVSRYGSSWSTAIDVCAVRADEPRGEPGADPVREEERLDLADRRDLPPGLDGALDRAARDRAARLRPHLAQPLGVAVELGEDVLGAEVLDDRAREGRTDAGDAAAQPERDALRRLRQRRAEGLDRELPAVARVLLDRAGDDEALAGRDVAERAAQRERALVLERRRPDRELAVGRDPARPAAGERDRELARLRVDRRLVVVERQHRSEATPAKLGPAHTEATRDGFKWMRGGVVGSGRRAGGR